MFTVPENQDKIKPAEIFNDLQKLLDKLTDSASCEVPAHTVERDIFQTLLGLGRKLLQVYFGLFGTGDVGENITLEEGQKLKRLPGLRRKIYRSIFGEIVLERAVYGTRKGQKIGYISLDKKLQLPDLKDSYLLQDWQQHFCTAMSFEQAGQTLKKILGLKICPHSLHRGASRLSQNAADFEAQKPAAPVAQEAQIVVSTIDGKGVPMRDGAKKMALVSSSYTVDPYPRSALKILAALFEEKTPENSPRPKPVAKRVNASLLRDAQNTMQPALESACHWLEREYRQRDPAQKQAHVALADGQKCLWAELQKRFGAEENYVEILDILHVADYVWQAAKSLTDKAEYQRFWARFALQEILQGNVQGLIYFFEYIEENRVAVGLETAKLKSVITYLKNNQCRMKYDQYLAAGYPIASGVIEGACRHVVKDRMERSGMRWTREGAQNILNLRCIAINDQWKDYMIFHIKAENQRLYVATADNDNSENMQMVA